MPTARMAPRESRMSVFRHYERLKAITMSEITPKQLRVIEALASGENITQASKSTHTARATIQKWLKDPTFTAALNDTQGQALEALTRSLTALAGQAGDVLREVLDDKSAPPAVRLRACDVVLDKLLKVRELVTLEARITALEARE